jgi:outer membrane protein assembly factor BamB
MGSSWRVPVLVEGVLLVGFWDQVIAIDSRTGQVIWRNQDTPFASNFAVFNDYLYALDYNARLVKLDIKTGQEKGYVQFTPARTNASEKKYSVAADGQMLFISFSDSQELIALGP